MTSSRLYVPLRETGAQPRAWVERAEPWNRGQAPRCPECGKFTGMIPWLPPYRANVRLHGQGWPDVILDDPSILVSGQFLKAYEGARLVGLRGFDPVSLIGVTPRRAASLAPAYFHSEIVYSNSVVDDSASGITRQKPITCSTCLTSGVQSGRGIHLRPTPKLQEDIFIPRGLVGILASERFRIFFEENHFQGVRFVDAATHRICL